MKIDLNQFLLQVCDIAVKAGSIINKFYKLNNNISFKEDQSPLTEADLASNTFIINSLSKLNSDIPIFTEESLVSWTERKNWSLYWLVDPLDGTKEFINKNDEFAINIALIENNQPILGVIYAPVQSILYFALANNGAKKTIVEKNLFSIESAISIKANTKKKTDHLIVIGSRSFLNTEYDKWLKEYINDYELIKKGSSLKFCELAEGKADIYPRFGPTSEWDIAAGHIILVEAGGEIQSIDGKKIFYNTSENVINPHFIASCKLIK